jgi:hypothetical protein
MNSALPVLLTSSPSPPSPRREGGKTQFINGIAPLPRERGWGEVKREGVDLFIKFKD